MTTISAVASAPAPVTANAPATAAGAPDFEVALSRALVAGPVQAQTASLPEAQTPIHLPLATTPPTDSDPQVQLPAQAIAAFLAIFLAMVGKALENGATPQDQSGAQVQAAALAGGVTAGSPAQLLASALQHLEATSGDGGSLLMATFDEMLGASPFGQGSGASTGADRPTNATDPLGDALRPLLPGLAGTDGTQDGPDQLVRMLEQLVAQLGASTNGLASATSVALNPPALARQDDPGGAVGNAVLSVPSDPIGYGFGGGADGALKALAGLTAKPTDLGGALTGVAAAAASFARELTAANGAIARARPAAGSGSAGGVQSASAPQREPIDRLAAMVDGARALVQIAEMGDRLNLGTLRGSSEVTIQLEPASLGTLQIHLERSSDGVKATIQATTDAGRRAVQEYLGTIRDALKGAGVQVSSIELVGPSDTVPLDGTIRPAQPTETAPTRAEGSDAVEPKPTSRPTTAMPEELPKAKDLDHPAAPVQTNAISQTTMSRVALPDAPAPSPEAAKLAKDIADQVSLLAGQGKSDFHIQLRPESLGRLNVHLSVDDGGVTVRMHADNAQAKAVIESNLGQLKQSFQDQGIRVDRFVVQVSQGQLSQDSQHPRRSRGWVDDVRPNRGNRGDDDFADALAAAGSGRPVDYRA
jgi:hypothetical protein